MQVQANRMQITRTWNEPVYEQKRLGSIPQDQYESVFMPGPFYGSDLSSTSSVSLNGQTPEAGNQDVWRNVPVYEGDKPKMTSVTRTLTENPYDAKKNSMISAGVGGALGVAAAAGLTAILGGGGAAMAVSGLLGGAAGGGAGYVIGQKSTQGDSIVEKTVTANIEHPTLVGYDHTIDPDVTYQAHHHYPTHHQSADGEPHTDMIQVLRGYQHNYTSNISNRTVGTYTYPTLEHTAKVGPGLGGVLSGLAGAGAGAAIAAVVCALI